MLSRSLQESLAHAKVSARQQCVYDGLKPLASEEIYDKSTQGTRGLQLCRYISFAYVVASQICKIQRNSTKIRTYSSSRSSMVIDLGVNQKGIPVCNFLLVINSIYVKKTYQFKIHCKDDVMISLH